MSGDERRKRILDILRTSKKPVSGEQFAKEFDVSRQVIVQDIALIRSGGIQIISTHFGYVLEKKNRITRVFKVIHTKEEVEEELNLFVDLGGQVEDVFVYHKVYGIMKAAMHLKSRWDIQNYRNNLSEGTSSYLMDITSGYHYHTITADNEEVMDRIEKALRERGFLAQLRDYEPVDFWKESVLTEE